MRDDIRERVLVVRIDGQELHALAGICFCSSTSVGMYKFAIGQSVLMNTTTIAFLLLYSPSVRCLAVDILHRDIGTLAPIEGGTESRSPGAVP